MTTKDDDKPVDVPVELQNHNDMRAKLEEAWKQSDGGKPLVLDGVAKGTPGEGLMNAALAAKAKLDSGEIIMAYVGFVGQVTADSADCGLEIVNAPIEPVDLLLLLNGNVAGQIADNTYAALQRSLERQLHNVLLADQLRKAKVDPEKGN